MFAIGAAPARAADDDDPDEYDETARVVRVSLIRGDVSLQRQGSKQWESAKLNFPLVEGDTLATGRDARLEIQIDSRNFVRVDENSVLRVVTLRDEGVALSLSEGTATLRLARFDRDHEYFEVDAPRTTVAAEQQGLYRLDVDANRSRVRLTVRDGGQARIYSDTSGFTLRDGRMAELVYEGSDSGDWDLTSARTFDPWDSWVNERERYLVQRLRYEQRDRYYDANVWGAEELDAYGEWAYVNDYGWIWRPHVTVINNYYNWTPYRYGHWTWCPPYGWTWVGDEPWGWAPYHYGRWVYYNNNWCWAPRGYGYNYHHSWWRPALVVFVYLPTSYGEHVAWYPLTYGQHDPRGRHYQQRQPLQPLRRDELSRLERTNPAFLRAVTTQPARDFGQQTARLQPATADLARRAVNTEPVRGRLPILPADQTNRSDLDQRTRPIATRPTPTATTVPERALQERPTGAARRTPGTPLDDELRRTRLYNNREPRPVSGIIERGNEGRSNNDGRSNSGDERTDTGAVARPPRARPSERQPPEREGDRRDNNDTGAPGYTRPARPPRANPGEQRTPNVDEVHAPGTRDGEPEPRTRPRPTAPPRVEDAPRSEPRYEPRPEPRAPRTEPRDEPRQPPRSEPRPEPRPEPRQEQRQEQRQEPRQEQRQEAPRQESRPAPPREEREDRPAKPARRGDEPGGSRR
ncbi:MAG TPA: DUF6600 domain-containing protein [Pyrinomonadaceae bacterium]|nr:DUF6600 domain-containing protein [Pyrinomonadaceae bacterium]